jgi:hypothetical protein
MPDDLGVGVASDFDEDGTLILQLTFVASDGGALIVTLTVEEAESLIGDLQEHIQRGLAKAPS